MMQRILYIYIVASLTQYNIICHSDNVKIFNGQNYIVLIFLPAYSHTPHGRKIEIYLFHIIALFITHISLKIKFHI